MIQEQYRDLALEVKEMLSSESGYVPESMAPVLGGPGHGDTLPIGYNIFPFRQKVVSERGGVLMDQVTMYFETRLDLDDENDIAVYADGTLLPEETHRCLEAWVNDFYEERMEEL